MKILITGSFCSGKSTLTSDLNNKLTNFYQVQEPARELISTLPFLQWGKEYIRIYLTVRQVIVEQLESNKYENILVDAGTISNIIHEIELSNTNHSETVIQELGHTSYDLILLCDYSEIDFYDDGKRITDLDLRKRIHQSIISYLDSNKLEYHLISGDREERLLSAIKLIKKC